VHNQENRELSDHQEMYLKVIYALVKEHKVARVKEISEKLEVTKSSVSGALKSLSEKGLIEYDPYSYVELTPKGERLGKAVSNKFEILSNFLVDVLDVPKTVADENACRLEHVIDDSVMEKLVRFLDFCKGCDIQCWKDSNVISIKHLESCCMKDTKSVTR
jgi:DtxR family Mn-dependent transcriptional regulator